MVFSGPDQSGVILRVAEAAREWWFRDWGCTGSLVRRYDLISGLFVLSLRVGIFLRSPISEGARPGIDLPGFEVINFGMVSVNIRCGTQVVGGW